jgi:hypothetical protein
MTFICNHQIESMDWNIQLLGVILNFLVTDTPNGVPPEEIDGHPLDGADVNEGVIRLRTGQIRCGQDWTEPLEWHTGNGHTFRERNGT